MPTASATVISGTANIGGTVTVNSGGVFFSDISNTLPNQFVGGTGTMSYAGLTGGTIQNLVGAPTTGPVSIPDFATFNVTAGTIHFDLTNLLPGVGTAAACGSNTIGNQCTPPNSPFTLTQLPTGVAILLNIAGNGYLPPSSSGTSPTTGVFSAQVQVPASTITAVLAAVATGTLGPQSYSANFTSNPPSSVPEPGTLTMLFGGAGMLAMGLLRKKGASRV